MPKRKPRFDDYDTYQDYEDADSAIDAMQPDVDKVQKEDFTIEEKVAAFVSSYEPCQEFDPGAERFDDAALRVFFKGWVHGLGDPLKIYIEHLKLAGFRMTVSLATDKPTIFARRKYYPTQPI